MKTALKLMGFITALVVFGLLAGCGQTAMYKARIDAQTARDTQTNATEKARQQAAGACYDAFGKAAANASDIVKVVAMAMIKNCDPSSTAPQVAHQQAPLPEPPESGVLTTLRIVDNLIGRGIQVYGIASGQRIALANAQSSERVALGQQAMFGNMFATQGNALTTTSGQGFGAIRDFGTAALGAVKQPAPNVTVNGGVLNTGSGTATLNSGDASGNSGTITKDSPTTITTQTCAATSGAGASGTATPPNGTVPAVSAQGQGGNGGPSSTSCVKG